MTPAELRALAASLSDVGPLEIVGNISVHYALCDKAAAALKDENVAFFKSDPTMLRKSKPAPEVREDVALIEANNSLNAKYLALSAQHARLCDEVYEDDGETLKQIALQSTLDDARAGLAGRGPDVMVSRDLLDTWMKKQDALRTSLDAAEGNLAACVEAMKVSETSHYRTDWQPMIAALEAFLAGKDAK